jgi:hypothetical protein
VAQLGVTALDKGWAIPILRSVNGTSITTPAGERRLDLNHTCSPEWVNTDGLASAVLHTSKCRVDLFNTTKKGPIDPFLLLMLELLQAHIKLSFQLHRPPSY